MVGVCKFEIKKEDFLVKFSLANKYKTNSKQFKTRNKYKEYYPKRTEQPIKDGEVYGIIYLIRNKENGKLYIGQTLQSFKKRYNGSLKNSHNDLIKDEIKIYGEDIFSVVECLCVAYSKIELDMKEAHLIKYLKTLVPINNKTLAFGYNKTIPSTPIQKCERLVKLVETYKENSFDMSFYEFLKMFYGPGVDFKLKEFEQNIEQVMYVFKNIQVGSIFDKWTIK